MRIKKRLYSIWILLSLSFACKQSPVSSSATESMNESDSDPSKGNLASTFIEEEITKTIAQTLSLKCPELLSTSFSVVSCQKAMETLAQELDFNIALGINHQSAFTFFGKSLNRLVAEPTTLEFIKKLQSKIDDVLYRGESFNLWDFTFEYSARDEAIALERIAVLLQDDSRASTQVKYLLLKKNKVAIELDELLRTFDFALKSGRLKPYPSSVNLSRQAIYHYYIPRFLSHRLLKKKIGAGLAQRTSFIFNSSYELHQIQTKNQSKSRDTSGADLAKDNPQFAKFIQRWFTINSQYTDLVDHLSSPFTPFNENTNLEAMEDLYLGYIGAIHGMNTLNNSSILTLQMFSNEFSRDPKSFVKSSFP